MPVLNRALPPLIEWLDKQRTPDTLATSAAPPASEPSTPVVEHGGELHHLIDQLDLAFGNSGVRLTFSSKPSGTVQQVGALILSAAALGHSPRCLANQP